jgi:hypothetical protein
MKDFQNKVSIYEMAQMDAFRSSLLTLRQLLDNKEDKEIYFPKKAILLKNADADFSEPYVMATSICLSDNDIYIIDVDGEVVNIENVYAHDIIEIASTIVINQ